MRVNEVMTKGVECIRPSESILAAAQKMKSLNVGTLPVCGENDRLVGMLTDRDIAIRAVAEGQDPRTGRVQDIMTPKVVYVFEDEDITEAARLMRENQIRRLIVLNRDKRLAGIVSLGDLAVDTHDEHLVGATLEAVSEPRR